MRNIEEMILIDASESTIVRPGGVWEHLEMTNYRVPGQVSRARLTEAQLIKVDLSWADLSGADLTGCCIVGCDLTLASLSEVNLSTATIQLTNLTYALLRNTRFEGAVLGDTLFVANDLSRTNGLDKCIHEGPSTVDHRTLQKSRKLPIEFLRGCGLPNFIIENLTAVRGEAVQFCSCFIGYSIMDQGLANELHPALQSRGVRCWLANHGTESGDATRNRIKQAIRMREKVLLILSEQAIACDWVQDEVESALEEERKSGELILFPIRIDDAVMETDEGWARKLRQQCHISDFTRWNDRDEYQKAFERLLRNLEAGQSHQSQ